MNSIIETRKTILFCTSGMGMGGVERSLIQIIKKLSPLNYKIYLLLANTSGELMSEIPEYVEICDSSPFKTFGLSARQWVKRNIKRFKIISAVKVSIGRLRHIFSPYLHRRIFNSLPTKEYDIAVCFSHTAEDFVYYIGKKIKAKQKFLWFHREWTYIINGKEHGVSTYRVRGNEFIDCIKNYNRYIFVSHGITKSFCSAFPELADKVMVLYNVVDREGILALSEDCCELDSLYNYEGKLTILSVGRLSPQKNFNIIPKASKILEKKGIDFIWFIIGEGPQRDELTKLIVELNLQKRVILLGTKKNPYPYIKRCAIYCQPSLYEAYCGTINEARILRRPIVCTDFAGIREQLADGQGGIIVDNNDISIANGIIKVLEISDDVKRKMLELADYPNEKELSADKKLLEIFAVD